MKTQLFTEIWKDIPGYIELYQTSNFGRVKSLNYNHTGKTKILKPVKSKKGYLTVQLYKDGKFKRFLVHRLVYEAFNGEITEGMEVNHINEIKTDNSLWNLNLMTPKENNNWGTAIKRRSAKQRNDHRSKKVRQCDLDTGELIKIWNSTIECSRNGFDRRNVTKCCNGKAKSSYGFKWEWLQTG